MKRFSIYFFTSLNTRSTYYFDFENTRVESKGMDKQIRFVLCRLGDLLVLNNSFFIF